MLEPNADAATFLLHTYPTKKTPVFAAAFTRANLLLAAGRYDRSSPQGDDGTPMEIVTDEA